MTGGVDVVAVASINEEIGTGKLGPESEASSLLIIQCISQRMNWNS